MTRTKAKFVEATCIGCGCTDSHACWDDNAGAPCHWLRVDYSSRVGVCSACPDIVADWDKGDRTFRVPVEPEEHSGSGTAHPTS